MLSAPLSTPAEKNLGATIRMGREIRCLLYAGFFFILQYITTEHLLDWLDALDNNFLRELI